MKKYKHIGATRLSQSEAGKNFMMDMSRGSGKHINKKHKANKYACRKKYN